MLLSSWLRSLKSRLAAAPRHPRRPSGPGRHPTCRPRLEALEDRLALSALAFTVTTTADTDTFSTNPNITSGSLRDAIHYADSHPGDVTTINFNLPAGDPNHFYYQNDGTSGGVSLAQVTTTTATDDATLANIDPDWAHSWWKIQP